MLRYEPTCALAFSDYFEADFNDQLTLLKTNEHLFNVYALDEPIGLEGEEKLIGKIHSESITTTSLWGDVGLFFRHQRFNDDLSRRPDWFDHVETFEEPLWKDSY